MTIERKFCILNKLVNTKITNKYVHMYKDCFIQAVTLICIVDLYMFTKEFVLIFVNITMEYSHVRVHICVCVSR
jgi:hypothetical protein